MFYLLLVLLFLHQKLVLKLGLHLCDVVSLFNQHLLYVTAAGFALLEAALQLAFLHFGGDQLKEKQEECSECLATSAGADTLRSKGEAFLSTFQPP